MADIEAEREMSRSDVAEYMRTFADKLDASGQTGSDGTASGDRTGTSDQRDADSSQRDGTTSNDDTETGTGNSDTTGNTNTTVDSNTTDSSNTSDRSSNDANETTTNDTTDDDHATDVEQRNRDKSNRSGGSGGRVTFMVGNESTTINPPENVTFAVDVDSESSLIGTGTGRTARFAIHWDESDVSDDDDLSIR